MQIFDAVVDLTGEDRAGALAAAVGDDAELRAAVESLLAADASLDDADDLPEIGGISLRGPLLPEGTVVDRYVVTGVLGEGGTAEVLAVEHRTLGTHHALKILHRPEADLRQRLLEEGRIQAQLRHPHIVRVTDLIELPQGLGLVMDRVDGPSLRARLRGGALSVGEAAHIGAGVLAGVAAAHAAGLVHRDIKPDNVLLEDDGDRGRPRVADFGLARPAVDPARAQTRTGVAMGTPGYIAPEQFRDARRAGPPADVFSLGCLLYELLVGRVPFRGKDLVDQFQATERGAFRRLADAAPGVPAAMAAVVERALKPVASLRFPDAVAMHEAWCVATAELDAGSHASTPSAAAQVEPSGAVPTLTFDAIEVFEADTVREHIAALLLTDVVDSTAMAQRIGDRRMAEIWAAHDRVARDLLAAHGGREIDKTDGFLLLFEGVDTAVPYAVAYHAALRALSTELGEPLAARAGLHLGPVVLRENTPDDVARGAKPLEVEGLAKPIAARIMSVASGGQTLLSPDARAALELPDLDVLSHGHWRLKGVAEPVELFEVGDDAAPFLPPPDGAKVYRVVRDGADWRPVAEVPHNLPPATQKSFGREAELRAIARAFSDGALLVTLLGPGGTGKTHLSQRFARGWLGDFPGGAWFCDLAEARTAAGIARALGAALSIPLDAGEPFEVLREAMAARPRTLVILDNMEQLIDVVDESLGQLVGRAAPVRWLATSRHRLDLRGERLLPLEPLPLPDEASLPEDIARSPAVQLFVDRARAARPAFSLDAAGAATVARLVHLLDGLPLAIELAAARVRVLPPKRILSRMGRRFDLLKGKRKGGRQSTLKAAIDWSWDLLDPAERAALARCAVFEGSFDLEAAEAVLELELDDAPWPTDLVESLVDKSLVRSQDLGEEVRFSLFRSIADYARGKLDDDAAVVVDGAPLTGPEARAEVEARHAEHYAQWGDPAARSGLYGAGGKDVRDRLARDLDNLVVAVHRCVRDGDGETGAALALGALALLEVTGPLALAEDVASTALKAAPPESAAALQVTVGVVRTQAGEIDRARAPLEAALDAADPVLQARARAGLAHGALRHGDLEAARAGFEVALAMFEAEGDARGEAECLRELAHVVGIRGGRFDEADAYVERARRRVSRSGDAVGAALTETYAGALACIQGHYAAGRVAYERARDWAVEVGDRRTHGLAESMLGTIAMVLGDAPVAIRHYGRALSIQRAIGDRVHEALTVVNQAELQVQLGEVAAATASFERTVELARQSGDPQAEGIALGWLAALRTRSGDTAGAAADFARAEDQLRAAGDLVELAKVVCRIAEAALDTGDVAGAAARIAQARSSADALDLAGDAEVAVMVDTLEQRLREAQS